MSSNLSLSELKKYGGYRIDVLLSKIEKGEHLISIDGDPVIIQRVECPEEDVKSYILNLKPGSSIGMIDSTGSIITTSSLKKTKEFGGVESTLVKESVAISHLNSQISNSIKIQINGKIHDVSSVKKSKGNVKSDFEILDTDQNPVYYVSHKHTRCQQWQSLSKTTLEKYSTNFVEFVEKSAKIVYNINNQIPESESYFFEIPDQYTDDIRRSIFGLSESKEYGLNNVNCVATGNVSFDNIYEDVYSFASSKTLFNNGISLPMSPDDPRYPVLLFRRSLDRSFMDIKNCRVLVYPREERKTAKKLDQ